MNGPSSSAALLKALASTRDLAGAEVLHGRLITGGLLSGRQRRLFLPRIAAAYALCGVTLPARRLFEDVLPEQRTSFLFNTLIRAYLQEHLPLDALNLFQRMSCRPDKFTFTFALKACADLSNRRGGEQLHCTAVVAGFAADGYVQNSLIAMYMSCGLLQHAGKVFDAMPERNVVSWNTMIAGFYQNGRPREATALFDEMTTAVRGGAAAAASPDCATAVAVLPACAALKDLERGRRVHVLAEQKGFLSHASVKNALIDMYAKGGSLEEARKMFDEGTGAMDVVSWTAMIGGYALQGRSREALALFCSMLFSGTRPNAVTVVSLLSAFTSPAFLRHGRILHGASLRLSHASELAVETALIDMYGECGDTELAYSVFSAGSKRTATWNAMISSFSQNGFPGEAVELFLLMRREAVSTDPATFAAFLPACSLLADLRQGSSFHGHVVKTGFDRLRDVVTGLMDLYAKAGGLDAARNLFDEMPERDTVAWSAIINAYGAHGKGREAAALFERMVAAGVEPNEVTFSVLLCSCSRAGLVDEGLALFRQAPGSSSCYAGAVDLLGRAGWLDEAHRLAAASPPPGAVAAWGALMGACVVHAHLQIGEAAAQRLFELEPENTGNYVLLGNLYASAGRWEDAERVRKIAREKGLKKLVGCSSVDAAAPPPATEIAGGKKGTVSYSSSRHFDEQIPIAGS